jgi:hypothetical protein
MRTDPRLSAHGDDARLLNIPTWTPPGRLTDESMRTASCRAFASTFHLRGCTFLHSLCFATTGKRKIRTSVIRPITRSPTSGLYLHRKWIRKSNLRLEFGVPRAQRSYRDKFVDSFNGACDGCDNFIAIHVSAMSPGDY